MVRKRYDNCLWNINIILEDQMGTGVYSLERCNKEEDKGESDFQRNGRIVSMRP